MNIPTVLEWHRGNRLGSGDKLGDTTIVVTKHRSDELVFCLQNTKVVRYRQGNANGEIVWVLSNR